MTSAARMILRLATAFTACVEFWFALTAPPSESPVLPPGLASKVSPLIGSVLLIELNVDRTLVPLVANANAEAPMAIAATIKMTLFRDITLGPWLVGACLGAELST